MKKTVLKTIGCLALVLTIAVCANVCIVAQDADVAAEESTEEFLTGEGGDRAIEGVWDVTVTIRDCQTGVATPAVFRAMDMFIRGGSVMDTNAAPPNTRGPGFGTWESHGRGKYSSAIRFFLYNPDGSFAGVRRLAQNVRLADDGWTSNVAITVFNPAGQQVAAACATAVATRFD